MGSPWKMPTYDQTRELIDGTNSTWITLNGKNGRKLTSKTDTSKYIFLTASGWWDNTLFRDATLIGIYNTTLLNDYAGSRALLIGTSTPPKINTYSRYQGHSVRSVR